jgi:hypothetical protein
MSLVFLEQSADFSECGKYRYRLERETGIVGPTAAVIMVNPSTATASRDDHTIRKLHGFAQCFRIGRFIVGNKFARIATNIRDLRTADDPVGPENDAHIERILRDADIHIVAWGHLSKLPPALRGRWRDVVRIADRVGYRLMCLGTALDGQPRHPLMLGYDVPLIPWLPPKH